MCQASWSISIILHIFLIQAHCEFPWNELAKLFSGHFLFADTNPEPPSPFGENHEYFHRDKTLECTCGLSKLALATEGPPSADLISPNDVPWLVLIYVIRDGLDHISHPSKICSGTIINDRVILTAASCLVTLPEDPQERINMLLRPATTYDPSPHKVIVLQAKNLTIDLQDSSTFTQLEVEEVTANPHFVYQQILHFKNDWDIAFIQLKEPLIFNETTGFLPVCLPSKFLKDKELEGITMTSFGWTKYTVRDSRTSSKSTVYSLKQNRVTQAHPKRFCRTITVRDWISERHFCTEGPLFIESKFIESHGGPLMVQTLEEPYAFVQYGIISWDLTGIIIRKKNVRVATNLSGFLQVIDDFSDSIWAQWCTRDSPGFIQPLPDPDWTGGLDLLDAMHLNMISKSEWHSVTSEYRQHYPRVICKCGGNIKGKTNKKYNWDVRIEVKLTNEQGSSCSGSIINDKVILTTASCLHLPGKFNEQGIAGLDHELQIIHYPENLTVNLNFYLPGSNSNTLKVAAIVPHFEYEGTMYEASEGDAALLILENRLPLQKLKGVMSPICLPETDDATNHDEATVILPSNEGLNTASLELFNNKSFCETVWSKAAEEAKNEMGIIPAAFKRAFHFTTKSCGGSAKENIDAILKTGNGQPIVTEDHHTVTTTTQIGLFSNLTNSIFKSVKGNKIATAYEDLKLDDKTILVYNEIKPLLPFIDYISLVADAKWCPPHSPH